MEKQGFYLILEKTRGAMRNNDIVPLHIDSMTDDLRIKNHFSGMFSNTKLSLESNEGTVHKTGEVVHFNINKKRDS